VTNSGDSKPKTVLVALKSEFVLYATAPAQINMTLSSRLTRRLPRYLIPLLAVCIVAGSTFLSGVHKQGGAKDIDTKYFYAAAKCWAAGESPYEPAVYDAAFYASFGSHPDAMFVAYLPTLMLVVLPMAPFAWHGAALLFSLMNFAAAMALFWACYCIVRESVGAPLSLKHWFWVVLASTVGAIPATIFTGQTSVFTAAAAALAIAGCRIQRTWMIVVGLVIATAKPHISGPLILFIVLFEPRQRRAIAIAAGIIVAVITYAAVADSNLLRSYLNSVRTYNSLAANSPVKQIGVVPLLLHFGIPAQIGGWLGLLSLICVLGLTAAFLRWRKFTLTEAPVAVMLLVFSIGLARPIQGYDGACYALGIALLATLELRFQGALLIPALLIWRLAPFIGLHLNIPGNLLYTYAWLGLLIGSVVIAVLQLRSRNAIGTTPLAVESISA
jgi:hypothetical protein